MKTFIENKVDDFSSKKILIKKDFFNLKTAQAWHELGENFLVGINGYDLDYIKAHICYLEALTYDNNHAPSQFAMGLLHHYGYGVEFNPIKARDWYAKAHKSGFKKAKKNLKDLIRTLALEYYTCEKNIDKIDNNGATLLHWATEFKLLKHAARLIILKADKEVWDAKNQLPFENLKLVEMDAVNSLQTQLSQLIHTLQASPAKILVSRIIVDRVPINENQVTTQLESIHRNPLFSPLLDLAKLCAIGLHNLSDRKKFKKNPMTGAEDYDSDEDADEKISHAQYLTIRIDPDSHLVCNVAHLGKEGLYGKNAHGIYIPKQNKKDMHNGNTVYIGGKRNSQVEFRGTFIHELTHFLARETFQNSSKPYARDDIQNTNIFTKIAQDLELKISTLDPILQNAFLPNYKTNDQIHAELIVRIPQIIVNYADGIYRLQRQAPNLLNFYKEVFLPKIKAHIEYLENRALGEWPRQYFVEPERVFDFDRYESKDEEKSLIQEEPLFSSTSAAAFADYHQASTQNTILTKNNFKYCLLCIIGFFLLKKLIIDDSSKSPVGLIDAILVAIPILLFLAAKNLQPFFSTHFSIFKSRNNPTENPNQRLSTSNISYT